MQLVLLILCSLGIGAVQGSKILFITPFPVTSHFYVFKPLIQELVNRKHEVHVLVPSTIASLVPRGVKIIETEFQTLPEPAMKDMILTTTGKSSIEKMKEVGWFSKINCENTLSAPTVKHLVSQGIQYDLAVLDMLMSECLFSMSTLVAKHSAYLSTTHFFSWKTTQLPVPPSYVPETFAFRNSHMNFFQRLSNAYDLLGTRYIYENAVLAAQQEILEKHFPNAPSVYKANQHSVFALTYSDPVMLSPRPQMPNVIHVGAMHCRSAKPLPKEFQDFADKSGPNGFMMFGLGTNAKSSFLPTETIKAFLTAFSRLKVRVIWKLEDHMDNLPSNVLTTKWMPQQDLLGHPKNRLFMTHGGLLSLQEAIYHGVPLLVIPLFAEQHSNAARIQELGIGECMTITNITADGVYDKITKLLNDKSFTENAKKYSAILKDQPEKPVDRAVFWTEYLIRHNGAHHLRSASENINFFQYFLLDVIAFVSLVAIVIVSTFAVLIKIIIRKLFLKKKKQA